MFATKSVLTSDYKRVNKYTIEANKVTKKSKYRVWFGLVGANQTLCKDSYQSQTLTTIT